MIKASHNQAKEKTYSPSQLKLEEILSIRELHLVRHHYTDLFYLHRKGDPDKPVRAIVQVPVSVTAYIDLKQIRLVKSNDSIREVILPKAFLEIPSYDIDKMMVTKTRGFQMHAGRDHYPEVAKYLTATMGARLDSIKRVAIRNQILTQAENEAIAYVTSLLKAVGRSDINVSLATEVSVPTPVKIPKDATDPALFRQERYIGVISLNL